MKLGIRKEHILVTLYTIFLVMCAWLLFTIGYHRITRPDDWVVIEGSGSTIMEEFCKCECPKETTPFPAEHGIMP